MSPSLLPIIGLDTRSLAAFRVGLGLLLIADVVTRARHLTAHYTDAGVLPRDALLKHGWQEGYWSVHMLDGGPALQVALFVVAALLAVQLILGWRTKIAQVGSWFLLASVQVRNPFVLQGGDDLLRLLAFWSMFLPLGAAWSLDARREGTKGDVFYSFAGFAYIIQLSLMYWATAILKRGPEWLENGTAVSIALRWETYSTPVADLLLMVPSPALRLLTWSVLLWEVLGPLLLMVPWRQERIRLGVVIGMVLMHLGFGMCLTLGLFSYTSAVAWLVLVPAFVWDRGRERGAPRILRSGRALTAVTSALLLFVVMWNARTLAFKTVEVVFPRSVNPIAYTLRLEQYWTMFAPSPPRHTLWWQVEGYLGDGTVVDLYAMGPLSDERPADISATFDGQRWRKFYFNLPSKRWLQLPTTAWLVSRWNQAHPDQPVHHVRLVQWQEFVRPRGHDPAQRKPIALFSVDDEGALTRMRRADMKVSQPAR